MPIQYPAPVYSHTTASSAGNGSAIDLGPAQDPDYRPALLCVVTGTVLYRVEMSHDVQSWVDVSNDGFSATTKKYLPPGIRFVRTVYVSGTGTLTSSIGPVSDGQGNLVQLSLYDPSFASTTQGGV